ncbi:hypothetical protein CGMCC3_g10164 [Colletotrichum fructicola]|nr:uncharacterized protein CGMCC3_g10164 [Colletotrichum fructicola]KAE9573772.1 hypothetical protein CGMCC3_g10164 [Colletotrichum fructicola]
MSLTKNILPLVVAVTAGVGISVYTLKPGLEQQQRLREERERDQLHAAASGAPKTPDQPIQAKR